MSFLVKCKGSKGLEIFDLIERGLRSKEFWKFAERLVLGGSNIWVFKGIGSFPIRVIGGV